MGQPLGLSCLQAPLEAQGAVDTVIDADWLAATEVANDSHAPLFVHIGRAEGAKPILPGGRAGKRGFFVKPTIFDSAHSSMRIAQEEIFGPVLTVLVFDTVEELVAKANSTIYGLAAAIWTRDVAKAHRLARQLKAGTVWINAYNMLSPESPFGGYKQSGYGRELGRYGIDLYTQVKSVWVSLD